jgi:hypothetical protein
MDSGYGDDHVEWEAREDVQRVSVPRAEVVRAESPIAHVDFRSRVASMLFPLV